MDTQNDEARRLAKIMDESPDPAEREAAARRLRELRLGLGPELIDVQKARRQVRQVLRLQERAEKLRKEIQEIEASGCA